MGVWRIARAGEQTKSSRLPPVAHVLARGRYYNNATITAALQAGNITVSWLVSWLVGCRIRVSSSKESRELFVWKRGVLLRDNVFEFFLKKND